MGVESIQQRALLLFVFDSLLFYLQYYWQITEAIRRYGVSDTTTALFVVRVASPDITCIEDKMNAVIQGTISPLSALEQLTDWSSVKKVRPN